MSNSAGTGAGEPAAPLEALDLEPLARWCGEVLSRGFDAREQQQAPPAADLPPLPAQVLQPLIRHGFDAFDLTVVALTLAPDLDPVLADSIGALTDGASRYPTLGLIADLVGARGAERAALGARLSGAGPLSRVGLIAVVPLDAPVVADPPRTPSMLAACAATTALLRWTFGITRLEPTLFPLVRDDLPVPSAPDHPEVIPALTDLLTDALPSTISLVGDAEAGLLATALAAVAGCGLAWLVVDAAALVQPSSAARVAAEALLREAVVIVTGDVPAVPPARWESLAWTVCIGAHPIGAEDGLRRVASLIVRERHRGAGGHNLVATLQARGLHVPDKEAARMRRWEHLPLSQIGALADTLTARSRAHAGVGGGSVTAEDVTSVSIGMLGNELGHLATALRTSRDWSVLVLPDELRRELGELVDQAEHRGYVLDTLGFGGLPGQPRGVTAVFAGPSGTGKTLASRLVAGELGLPLYRVDLARVVSKYIGETERNLDAVFAAAERTDAVLLFDEAESLFGRRSEVQDARDRYANLEISFLLQRMEDYEGVAILGTNLLNHLDDAFARRMSFCLHFPFPDAAQRLLIWRAVWPSRAHLDDGLDFDELARTHELSGGHIRNIAVAAAHLARSRGTSVDQACLTRAVEREYSKLGFVPDLLVGVAS